MHATTRRQDRQARWVHGPASFDPAEGSTAVGPHPAWLLSILLVAALLRLPGLERVPPRLNQDEASRGYDAWAILETGADRHGQPWPFFLKSFGDGDYTAALTTYLTVPFVAVLGPTATAMRLPDAILGVLTVLILYLWIGRQIDPATGLVAAAALAVDPWHISLCRTAHESGFAPFFMASAMLCLHRCGLLIPEPDTGAPIGETQGGTRIWAFSAGFMLVMHTWVYPATRMFTPLFLIGLAVINRRHWARMLRARARQAIFLPAVVGLVLGGIPLWLTALTHPEFLAARARVTLIVNQPWGIWESLRVFVSNLWLNIEPWNRFVEFHELSDVPVPWVGMHLLVTAPLVALGLVCAVVGCRASTWCRIICMWAVLHILPAAACAYHNPHPLRLVAGVCLTPILTAMGALAVARQLATWQRGRRRLAVVAVSVVAALNMAHFVNSYFRRFPHQAEPSYQTGLIKAIEYVGKMNEQPDFILVTNIANQAYIFALLGHPILPTELPLCETVINTHWSGFDHVLRIGKYFFAPSAEEQLPEAGKYFRKAFDALPPGSWGLVIDMVGRFKAGKRIETFATGDGSVEALNFEVRRWEPGKSMAHARAGPTSQGTFPE